MATRREFIKKAVASSAALSVGGVISGVSAKSYRNIAGANDKIRIAAIGVNARGNALAGGFAREKGCEVNYVCDVDTRAMDKCIANIAKISGEVPRGEKDIRRLLEKKDFDAVIIATPEHWHAPAALMAMKADKHVYLEKPTGHNPAENELLMQATIKYNRVVQTGMQRRSWPNVIQAIQEIKEGAIGEVYFGKAWYAANRPSIGVGKVISVPQTLDWELWQGPAPRVRDYKDNIVHYNWHWFYDWGTGESGNNGVHFLDILRWGMDLSFPTRVSSSGGRYVYEDDWQFPDTQIVNLEYANRKMLTWEGRSCNGRSIESEAVGCAFYGEKGTLVLGGGNSYKIYDLKNNLIKEVQSDLTFRAGDTVNPTQQLDGYHFKNFLDGIRSNTQLNADIEVGAISSTLALLGNISQRVGATFETNPLNGHIMKNKAASKLWSRRYEKGWDMKL